MFERLRNNKPSKNADTFTKWLWIAAAFILLYLFFDAKMAIDSMAQDYPNLGLAKISKWAPIFFPVPSACSALCQSFPKFRKILKFIFVAIIVVVVSILAKIYSDPSILWVQASSVLTAYLGYILLGSIMACESPKRFVGNVADQIMGWDH